MLCNLESGSGLGLVLSDEFKSLVSEASSVLIVIPSGNVDIRNLNWEHETSEPDTGDTQTWAYSFSSVMKKVCCIAQSAPGHLQCRPKKH